MTGGIEANGKKGKLGKGEKRKRGKGEELAKPAKSQNCKTSNHDISQKSDSLLIHLTTYHP